MLLFISHQLIFVDGIPDIGPHPNDIQLSYLSDNLRRINIPFRPSFCKMKTPPNISTFSFDTDYFDSSLYNIKLYVNYCERALLRYRIISYSERKVSGKIISNAKVLASEKRTKNIYYNDYFPEPICGDEYIYGEVCVRIRGQPRPLCSMSSLKLMRKYFYQEPVLKPRPPPFIYLSPGDKFHIAVKKHQWSRKYYINSLIESKDGKTLKKSGIKLGEASSYISRNDTLLKEKGTYLFHNAVLKFQYRLKECPEQTKLRSRAYTKIFVTRKARSLVRQDSRAPVFLEQPFFPLSKPCTEVIIRVKAENVGGGFREGGEDYTPIYYRFYLTTGRSAFQYDAGLTSLIQEGHKPWLKIKEAQCSGGDYDYYGSEYGLQIYQVEICNTFGCVYSSTFEAVFWGKNPGHPAYNFTCSGFDRVSGYCSFWS